MESGLNVLTYVGFSLAKPATALRAAPGQCLRGRADLSIAPSFRLFRASISVDELRATVARYLGEERTRCSFRASPTAGGRFSMDAPRPTFTSSATQSTCSRRRSRRLLAARPLAPGAPAQRLHGGSPQAARRCPPRRFSTAATCFSMPLITRARASRCSTATCACSLGTRAFIDLYELPPDLVRVGVGLEDIACFNAERGSYGTGPLDDLIATRISSLVHDVEPVRLRPSRPARSSRSARTSCPTAGS